MCVPPTHILIQLTHTYLCEYVCALVWVLRCVTHTQLTQILAAEKTGGNSLIIRESSLFFFAFFFCKKLSGNHYSHTSYTLTLERAHVQAHTHTHTSGSCSFSVVANELLCRSSWMGRSSWIGSCSSSVVAYRLRKSSSSSSPPPVCHMCVCVCVCAHTHTHTHTSARTQSLSPLPHPPFQLTWSEIGHFRGLDRLLAQVGRRR